MARRKQPSIRNHLLAEADPTSAFAKDGLLDESKKAYAGRALNAEIDHSGLQLSLASRNSGNDPFIV